MGRRIMAERRRRRTGRGRRNWGRARATDIGGSTHGADESLRAFVRALARQAARECFELELKQRSRTIQCVRGVARVDSGFHVLHRFVPHFSNHFLVVSSCDVTSAKPITDRQFSCLCILRVVQHAVRGRQATAPRCGPLAASAVRESLGLARERRRAFVVGSRRHSGC